MRVILIILVGMMLTSCATQPVERGSTDSNRRVARNPEAANLNVQLGANYIASGDYRLADEKLQKAFKQGPQSSVARWTYAILQEQLERPQAAEEYYKKALAINQNDSRGQYNYASFLCRHSRYQDADKHFKKALSDPLYNARVETNLTAGVCLMEIPDYMGAKNYFTEVLRIQPKHRVALYQISKAYFLQNDFAISQSYMRDFEEVSQHTSKSLWLAYRTERGLGNVKIAQSYAKLLTSQFPTSNEAEKLTQMN